MPSLTEIIAAIGRYLVYDPDAPLLFSSGTFWALFIVFMPLYGLLRNRVLQMSAFVVAFSLFFYYKCSGWFALLLVSTSLVDWLLSQAMATEGATRSFRRGCVVLSLLSSLSVLAYFKYANFFLWNFHAMLGGNFQPLDLVLPVGISFYTFQSVSYIIDVYKNKVQPARTWLEYAFFLSFFPALVAGPIVRADYFLPQIRQNRHASRNEVYTGLWLIILGVFKKAVIADYIAMYNDLIFDAPGAYTGFEALMGIVGYAMQIYCDFSGYSDMAIGLALIMGFRLALNFDFPYKARNISDFWHRWHISLSTWLRDYVYIPLGGNRKGKVRTYVNLMATMLIGGLWHGAAWKFVLWGGVHGAGLAAHKAAAPVDALHRLAFDYGVCCCALGIFPCRQRLRCFRDYWLGKPWLLCGATQRFCGLAHAVAHSNGSDNSVAFFTVRYPRTLGPVVCRASMAGKANHFHAHGAVRARIPFVGSCSIYLFPILTIHPSVTLYK